MYCVVDCIFQVQLSSRGELVPSTMRLHVVPAHHFLVVVECASGFELDTVGTLPRNWIEVVALDFTLPAPVTSLGDSFFGRSSHALVCHFEICTSHACISGVFFV